MTTASRRKPRRRRQYGSGSVYWSETDHRWVGSILHGYTPAGNRRRITVSCNTPGDEGEAECRRRLDDRIAELHRGVERKPRATVKTWADEWLAVQVHSKRPKSFATDQSSIRTWVIPTIGHKRLDELTPADVRSVATAIRAAGLAPSSALRAQVVLKRMLRDAATEGGHTVNQAIFLIDNPGRGQSGRDRVELAHALLMLQEARKRPDGSRWLAAFLQGVRPGECLGLRWALVDFDAMTLDNSWQLQQLPFRHGCDPDGRAWTCGRRFGGDCPARALRVPDGYEHQQLDGGYSLVRPKSEAGKRMMPLIDVMAAELEAWRKLAPASPHDLVWPRPDGRAQDPKLDRAAWKQLQTDAGVRSPAGRPYDLYEARHTTATLLMELGVPEDVRKAIMGHSSMASTRHYQHVSLDGARNALDGVAVKLGLAPASQQNRHSE